MPPPIRPTESAEGLEDVDLENAPPTYKPSTSEKLEQDKKPGRSRRHISTPVCVGLLFLVIVILIIVITLSVKYSKDKDKQVSATTATLSACSWQKIMPFDPSEKKKFGKILKYDQNTLAIGAQGDNENGKDSGSVYIYQRDKDTGEFRYDTKLVTSDGAEGDTASCVDISGKFVAVGAKKHDHFGEDSGAVYIFMRKSDGTYIEEAKIVPPDGEAGDVFGNQLAIDDKTLLVGARGRNDLTGGVYVYRRQKGRWKPYGKNGNILLLDSPVKGDEFGARINMRGKTAVVTKNGPGGDWAYIGGAYVFKDNGVDGFVQLQELLPDEIMDTFGKGAIDINKDEDTIAVGAYKTDKDSNYEGFVYIYTLGSDGLYSQTAKIVPGYVDRDYLFSRDVDLSESGKTLLVLADTAYGKGSNTGVVYVFSKTEFEWEQQTILVPASSDPLSKDGFGNSLLALDDHTLLIGSRYDSESGFSQSGAIYMIELC